MIVVGYDAPRQYMKLNRATGKMEPAMTRAALVVEEVFSRQSIRVTSQAFAEMLGRLALDKSALAKLAKGATKLEAGSALQEIE